MSRFVSAGTEDDAATAERDGAWQKAQQQIDAARSQTTAQRLRPGEQEGGKSLYETLQANKAAKQEAFEEQNRLRNQFRSLDDDEVEFLDSVMESTRAKEAEVRREMRDQLDAFRRLQEEGAGKEKGGDGVKAGEAEVVGETWNAGPRKRKKGREGLVGGVKVRRTSGVGKEKAADPSVEKGESEEAAPPPAAAAGSSPTGDPVKASDLAEPLDSPKTKKAASASPSPTAPPSASLGLGAYSSDEDD